MLNYNISTMRDSCIKKGLWDIRREDVEDIIEKEREISQKIGGVDRSRFAAFVGQLNMLLEMLKDYWNGIYKDVPWSTIGMVTFAILYFVNPFDLVSDLLPILGFGDDAAVVVAILKVIRKDMQNYAKFKGYNL